MVYSPGDAKNGGAPAAGQRLQDAAPTRVAGVGVTVQRRISRQRKQRRQPGSQPIADLDGGRAVGYLHVHMTSADPLLVRDHSELRTDPPVPFGAADRELVRRHRRVPEGQKLNPGGLGRFDRGAPQPGEFVAEFCTGSCHAGSGLDLTTAQFQLQCDAATLGLCGHRHVMRGRFAGPRVNEEERPSTPTVGSPLIQPPGVQLATSLSFYAAQRRGGIAAGRCDTRRERTAQLR